MGTVDPAVRARIVDGVQRTEVALAATVERRDAMHRRLLASGEAADLAAARPLRDFLVSVAEARRRGAPPVIGADQDGRLLVGRHAVLDDDKDVLTVPWHAPRGRQLLFSTERLLVRRGDDGPAVLRSGATRDELAPLIRTAMRAASSTDEMSDPLGTLTEEQVAAFSAIVDRDGDVLLDGPPGSGKSAILVAVLAYVALREGEGRAPRLLLATASERLVERVRSLTQLLGVDSVVPITHEQLAARFGLRRGTGQLPGDVQHHRAPVEAMTARLDEAIARLRDGVELAHPLGGTTSSLELPPVRAWAARVRSRGYREVARRLESDLAVHWEAVVGTGAADVAAAQAAAILPGRTPSELAATAAAAVPGLRRSSAFLPHARRLLDRPVARSAIEFDHVFVDEYQRLSFGTLSYLPLVATRIVLSGDHRQVFGEPLVGASPAFPGVSVTLTQSLRVGDVVAVHLAERLSAAGHVLPPVDGVPDAGRVEVRTTPDEDFDVAAAAVDAMLVPESWEGATGRHVLPVSQALGLEWPRVGVWRPDEVLAGLGPGGLLVACTRAIDELVLHERG